MVSVKGYLKAKRVIATIRVLLILSVLSISTQPISAQTGHIVKLGTRIMSLEAVDSYPQRLLEVCENSDSAVIVRIATHNEWEDIETVNQLRPTLYQPDKVYDSTLQEYLQPTSMVNSNSEITRQTADTLFTGQEKTLVEVIRKALSVFSSLLFDHDLAQRIYNGEVMCVCSDEALKSGKGACSECTNVFMSLMRNRNVPVRFVRGMTYHEGNMTFQAWAEVWFEGFGWWAVDPQTGNEMIPYYFYKLHAGADELKSCNHHLKDYYFNDRLIIAEERPDKYQF